MMFAVSLMVPVVSPAAMVWSACETITSVNNWMAFSNSVYFTVSPVITGCTINSASAVQFVVGDEGVTSTNITSIFATGLTAFTNGQQVMIYYDNTTLPACQGQVIAIDGYSAQCS
jgi:hypothetical protein